jgi:type IV pilus assembly protein PilM
VLSRSAAGTGIDLGHSSIKLVRVEPGRQGGARLTHWGVEEMTPEEGATSQGRIRALKRLLKGLKLKSRQLGRVATAVTGRDVYLRQVSMPVLSDEDLRRALPFEAKKHFPLDSLPNPVLDFQILGPSAAANGNGNGTETDAPPAESVDVLLVAAPRRRRDEILRVLDGAGIDPEVVGAEPLPTVNAILDAHADEKGELMVVVGLGAEVSFLAAVDAEGGLYARHLAFCGEALTKHIVEKLNFDRASAEAMKRDLKGPESRQVLALLEEPIQELMGEIAETVRCLGVRRRTRQFTHLFLCGGGALTTGLRDELARGLAVRVDYPDPFGGLRMPGDTAIQESDRVRLVGAVGLARGWGQSEV